MAALADIIGHALQVQSLQEDLALGNVAHAYLFAGKKHLGKCTVARWFAQALLTVDAKDAQERGKIERDIERLLHPDLLVIDRLWIEEVCEDNDLIAQYSNVPQQHRVKAGAKTDTISIEDIRALQERLHEVSGGRFRCCIIRSVERLQEEAVNALLKILEEPPPGVVFLLTTESFSSLLPTLVSRSRILHFASVPTSALIPLVSEAPPDDAQFLLRLAQGAPGIIFQYRDDPDALRGERQRYAQAVAFWHASTLLERMRLLEPLHERTAESHEYLLHLFLALWEELPSQREAFMQPLLTLARDLRTNASRPLLTQRFACSITGT